MNNTIPFHSATHAPQIEGKIGYVGETDVRIDTSAQGYSWSNEVLNKQQFEDSLRRDEPTSDESLDKLPISGEVNGEWQTFPDAAVADEALNTEPVPEAAGNFRITDDHLGEGGAKQKYAFNTASVIIPRIVAARRFFSLFKGTSICHARKPSSAEKNKLSVRILIGTTAASNPFPEKKAMASSAKMNIPTAHGTVTARSALITLLERAWNSFLSFPA